MGADEVMKKMQRDSLGIADTQKDGSVTVGSDWVLPVAYPTKRKFAPHKEDDMEEEVIETKKTRNALLEKPVENNGPVPLMPNLDANARHVITSIRVNKRTPPNDGVKGDVPESTTLEFIARRWGDGIYDFEALNESGQILRRNPNVKIAMGYQQPIEGVSPLQKLMTTPASSDVHTEKLLERLDKESQRSHEAAQSAVMATKQLSQDYAAMVREDAKERADKDRAYHDAQNKQQSNFFQTMLVSMQTMHEQSLERSREQFQQTIAMMQFSHQQTMSQNNPALLFQLFERGLQFGANAGGSDVEESPLSSILGAGLQGLSTMKEMMQLQSSQPSGMLPASAPSPVPVPRKNPDKKPPITKAEMLEILKLKKIAEAKGLPFDGLVKQAQTLVSNMPVETAEASSEENESGEESDDEESGESDVD